jgi:multiple sugar transport system permease protein
MRKRPPGISIISIVFLAISSLAIAGMIFVSVRRPSSWVQPSETKAGITGLILACAMGLIGWGLWRLLNWARTGLILLATLSVIEEIGRRFASGHPAIAEIVFQVAVFALLLWYLRLPGVRSAFRGDSGWGKVAHWTVLAVFTVLLAFPFYWMAIATFKQDGDLYATANNPFLFNLPPTLDHLRYLFGQTDYLRWLGNTALVGVLVVAITLLLSIPAAYALARLTGRWGERLGIAIFLTYLVPPTLLFIPLSRVVAILGLQDSLWSLVVVYPSVTIPFSIWLLMGFFKSIPRELEDAAMVDGLTRFGAFVKMVVPISLSGILTVVIFTFTLVTQEFVYAVTFISPKSTQMVGVGVPNFLVLGDVYYWGGLMAACLIASLPVAFLYNLFLDRFIAGFTVGAVKG